MVSGSSEKLSLFSKLYTMAKLDRAALKDFFEFQDKPEQDQFADLIDSFINLVEESEIEATIIVNIPVSGTGAGGKVLKKGDALIQMGEFSDNDTAISSDNGGFAAGGNIYIGSSFVGLSFGAIQALFADATLVRMKFASGNEIELSTIGGNERINIAVKDELMLGKINSKLGFFGKIPTHGKQTITGSKAGNAALGSLLTALENLDLIIDNTT